MQVQVCKSRPKYCKEELKAFACLVTAHMSVGAEILRERGGTKRDAFVSFMQQLQVQGCGQELRTFVRYHEMQNFHPQTKTKQNFQALKVKLEEKN